VGGSEEENWGVGLGGKFGQMGEGKDGRERDGV